MHDSILVLKALPEKSTGEVPIGTPKPFAFFLYGHEGPRGRSKPFLRYRYQHLDKAIENAEKLGFSNGAALSDGDN